MRRTIAVDYDGTITSDPAMWLLIISQMVVRREHTVAVVSMRYDSEVRGGSDPVPVYLLDALRVLGVPFVTTGRRAKAPYCEAMGMPVHIWIDDNPRAVNEDATQIWSTQCGEGNPVDPCKQHGNG